MTLCKFYRLFTWIRTTKFKHKNSKNLKYNYLSSKKKLPQWDIRISSVSVVSVPLSRAQPLIIIDPLPSAKMYVKYKRYILHSYPEFSLLSLVFYEYFLPYFPATLMQDDAGKSPFRPFRPPMHGRSKISVV